MLTSPAAIIEQEIAAWRDARVKDSVGRRYCYRYIGDTAPDPRTSGNTVERNLAVGLGRRALGFRQSWLVAAMCNDPLQDRQGL